nr:type IV secretion system protein [Roseicella sp. DB1501]
MLYVVIAAVLVMYAKMDGWDAVKRGVRAMAIIALLQAGTYGSMVREQFWTTIPNLVATSLSGNVTAITAAQRFDRVDMAASNLIARADGQAAGLLNLRPQIAISFAQAAIKVFLLVSFALWLVSRVATALLIAVGPFLLIAWLFDATRGWVLQWIGKLIGLAVWQLCAAILAEMVLRGSMYWVQRVAAFPGAGLAEMLDGLWKVAIWFGINMLVMLGLPYYAAIGSSSAAGAGVAVATGGALVGGAASMGARAGAAAASAAMRAGGAAYQRMRRNSSSSSSSNRRSTP